MSVCQFAIPGVGYLNEEQVTLAFALPGNYMGGYMNTSGAPIPPPPDPSGGTGGSGLAGGSGGTNCLWVPDGITPVNGLSK